MIKIGVQVQTHRGGEVKLNEWKTAIEPVPLDELDANKLRGLSTFKARLIFQVECPEDARQLTKALRNGRPFSGGDADQLLTLLLETFSGHPMG